MSSVIKQISLITASHSEGLNLPANPSQPSIHVQIPNPNLSNPPNLLAKNIEVLGGAPNEEELQPGAMHQGEADIELGGGDEQFIPLDPIIPLNDFIPSDLPEDVAFNGNDVEGVPNENRNHIDENEDDDDEVDDDGLGAGNFEGIPMEEASCLTKIRDMIEETSLSTRICFMLIVIFGLLALCIPVARELMLISMGVTATVWLGIKAYQKIQDCF